jgi:hypothetical protein
VTSKTVYEYVSRFAVYVYGEAGGDWYFTASVGHLSVG